MKKVTLKMEITVEDTDVTEFGMYEFMGIIRHKFSELDLSEEIKLACINESTVDVQEIWGVEIV